MFIFFPDYRLGHEIRDGKFNWRPVLLPCIHYSFSIVTLLTKRSTLPHHHAHTLYLELRARIIVVTSREEVSDHKQVENN